MLSMDSKLEAAVGAKSAKALAGALDLHTVGDLVRYFPRRYAERGQLTDIAGLEIGEHVTVMARVPVAQRAADAAEARAGSPRW